jgi:hypothetical protein
MADFNGDEFADLAVGVQREDLGQIVDGGAVNVLYGSPGGLQATSPDDQLLIQSSVVGDGPEGGDLFGSALASGDYDGDGFSDLAVGAAGEDVGPIPDAGAVSVVYGSAGGLQVTDPPAQFWTQDSVGVDDQAEVSDRFGLTLTSGDFDGNGFDDLAVGAPLEDVPSAQDAGSTNVLYGSAGGLQTTSPPDELWTQDSPGVADESEPADAFRAITTGDFNGDGFDDLLNGAPGETLTGAPGAGGANVLYGSPQGLQTALPADQFWTQDTPWVDSLARPGEGFAIDGTAGDFNGDGYDDAVIGVPGEDAEGQSNAGAINVLYGSVEGLQTDSPQDPPEAPDDQLWTQDSPFLGGLAEPDDVFGARSASGDFNGDGRDDLAVGPRGEDIEGTTDAGGINLMYGSDFGLQAILPNDQLWNQDVEGVKEMNEEGDRFGYGLAASDFNGDGYGDLAVGIVDEDLGTLEDGGALAILHGSEEGVQADAPDDQFWSQDSPSVREAAGVADGFGNQLAM